MSFETLIFFNLGIYLIGFVVLLGIGNSVFKEFSGWISTFINLLGVITSLSLQLNTSENWEVSYKWIQIGETIINYDFIIDNQTIFMHLVVQVVSAFVQLFSIKYLEKDFGINRFFAFINLFVFSMLGLVVSNNLLQLFIFWELVGFCSYLLIGFWYEKKSANEASLKAFLMNRFGDAFFLTGIILLYSLFKTLNFSELSEILTTQSVKGFEQIPQLDLRSLAIFLIFVGVMSKSAQFPFETWLPDAMEGPTPASALIHAATMVVAGVFLLGRIAPIITPQVGTIIAFIGAFTSIIAGFSAIFQYDIKKVLAYSTISQVGFMIAGIGIGAIGATFFHLTTHAFFKAGLFLCAGVVINYFNHDQDMRKMGNLTKKLPFVFYAYLICGSSLIGLPFTSGYLSKESILNASVNFAYMDGKITYKILIPIFLAISSFMTTYYIVRQFVMVFFQRQDDPVEKIFGSTKRTFKNVVKTFQDVLNAENESVGEDNFIRFFRNLGIYEVSILFMAILSTFFFFSDSPIHFDSVWFLLKFKASKEVIDWIPFAVSFLTLLALLISFNLTTEEIRKFYFKEKSKGWRRSILRLGFHHFYLDSFLQRFFTKLVIGVPIANMDSVYSNVKQVRYKYIKGLTNTLLNIEKNGIELTIRRIIKFVLDITSTIIRIEVRILDAFVLKFSTGIKNAGNFVRKIQGGNLQLYLLGMLLIVLAMVLIKIIIF